MTGSLSSGPCLEYESFGGCFISRPYQDVRNEVGKGIQMNVRKDEGGELARERGLC